jgi:uncharacterized protein involved in exopolysaccharide biosynthesis
MTLTKPNFDQPIKYLPLREEVPPPQASPSITFRDVVLMIYRRRWLAAGLFVAIFLIIAAATFMTPSIYVARAQILLKRERANSMISPSEATGADLKPQISEETLNSEIEILKSTTLLREVLRTTGLYNQVISSLDTSGLDEEIGLEIAVATLKKGFDSQVVPKSNIIQVTYESKDPRLAAEIVNALCHQYVDRHLEVHESQGIYNFFQKQSDVLHDTLRSTAALLKHFEAENGLIDPEKQRALMLQQLADYETRLSTARADEQTAAQQVEFLERQLAIEPDRVQDQTRDVSNKVLESLAKELVSLQFKYDELVQDEAADPQSKARLARSLKTRIAQVEEAIQREENAQRQDVAAEINRSMMELSTELTRARVRMIGYRAQENELANAISQLKRRMEHLESSSLIHEELRRQWELNQNNFLLYAKKQEEARISEALDREKVANVSIIDPASIPLTPARPNRKLNLAMGFLLALFVSAGTAFGVSYFDGLIHTSNDIERQLDVPLIVAIPEGQWPPNLLLEESYDYEPEDTFTKQF